MKINFILYEKNSRGKNHLIFTNIFFNSFEVPSQYGDDHCGSNSRQKKPVIKETILIEKSMTLGKSKSLHFQPGQRSRQLANISSTARSNGISWWDFGWVLLVDGVHLSLLDLSWPALSHFLINLAGWAGEAGILAKISIMPVSTERFRLAIYTRPIVTTLSVQAHRLKKKEETLSSHGWGFGGFYLVGISFQVSPGEIHQIFSIAFHRRRSKSFHIHRSRPPNISGIKKRNNSVSSLIIREYWSSICLVFSIFFLKRD